jgi:hypothetical protein
LALWEAFNRIHGLNEYIKFHKELIKIGNISCPEIRGPNLYDMEATEIEMVARILAHS